MFFRLGGFFSHADRRLLEAPLITRAGHDNVGCEKEVARPGSARSPILRMN